MLQIRPKKFYAKHVELGSSVELDLGLGNRNLALTVDVSKSAAAENEVIIHLHLKVVVDDEMSVRLHYCGEFEVAEKDNADFKVAEETLKDTFMQVNAPAIAYPYVRAFVSSLCAMAGYQAAILPPVNFQALFGRRKEDNVVDRPIKLQQ
jgi:preprotein translocase subunit SecB